MNDVNDLEVVAANVRREMAMRGWSQTDLAQRTGLKQAQVSEILSGKRDHGLKKLGKVAKAFGLRTSALLMPLPDEEIAIFSGKSA